MVKIQTRIVRKKYRDKVHTYTQNVVVLPLSCNENLAPFLGQQLNLKIEDCTLILSLKKPAEEAQDGARN